MAFYFIFWDGVGYGKRDPIRNPFFAASLPTLRSMFGGMIPSLDQKEFSSKTVSLSPVNTTLRVPGLPQSGTGQTAMMTGINAPKFVGKHFGPHPYSTLIPVIKEHNLFVQLQKTGLTCYFANGYPKRYFDFITGPKGRIPTIALSYLSAGKKLNDHAAVKNRTAISADITGTRWNELGHPDISPVDPSEAGAEFYRMGKQYDLLFFEYFITDQAGHSRDMDAAVNILERMDGFLAGMLKDFDAKNDIILIISDHGNIEDLSTKSHTRNPVPLIVIGNHHRFFSSRIKNLTNVTPSIIEYFTSM